MSRSRKNTKNKSSARGPIARKVIKASNYHFKNKIINLSDWRESKIIAEEYQKSVISENNLEQYDPLHAVYMYAQNQLSLLIEQITALPMLKKLSEAYEKAEEDYLPSYPPMSPLTKSYFFCWGAFDLSTGGAKKETIASVVIDFCKSQNTDEGLLSLFETMLASRMGVYKHEGSDGEYVFLKELVTNKEIKVISTSGYSGLVGEIWFVRVLPPPFGDINIDYSVVFTTPYILGEIAHGGSFNPSVEKNWLSFFERNIFKMKVRDRKEAYENLMKYGLSKNYWNEYIFLAYRNHTDNMILLEGFPDVNSSLPHAKLSMSNKPL